MKTWLWLSFAGLFLVPASWGGKLFEHDFDRSARRGSELDGGGVYGHEVMDKGVTETHYVSSRQSAFVVVDFDQSTFGAIFIRDADEPLDLRGAHLAVQVSASEDITERLGVIGFQLVDSDGTVARTDPEMLFSPSTEFKPFLQSAHDMNLVTERGDDGNLNLESIAKYGILFLDRGDLDSTVTFYFDDFTATKGD